MPDVDHPTLTAAEKAFFASGAYKSMQALQHQPAAPGATAMAKQSSFGWLAKAESHEDDAGGVFDMFFGFLYGWFSKIWGVNFFSAAPGTISRKESKTGNLKDNLKDKKDCVVM